MTTDDTTTDDTTTETQRSVGDLLELDTYQGMTDAEIQSLIDYWRQYGYNEGYVAKEIETTTATQDTLVTAAQDAYESSQKAFDAAIQTQVTFAVYDGSVSEE